MNRITLNCHTFVISSFLLFLVAFAASECDYCEKQYDIYNNAEKHKCFDDKAGCCFRRQQEQNDKKLRQLESKNPAEEFAGELEENVKETVYQVPANSIAEKIKKVQEKEYLQEAKKHHEEEFSGAKNSIYIIIIAVTGSVLLCGAIVSVSICCVNRKRRNQRRVGVHGDYTDTAASSASLSTAPSTNP